MRWTLCLGLWVVSCGGTTPSAVEAPSPAATTQASPQAAPGDPPKTPAKALTPLPPSAEGIGAAAPTVLSAAAPSRNWLAFCQARSDTDANGRIEVRVGGHGELLGDALTPYLTVQRAGDHQERSIERWLGSDPSGRHVAFQQDGQAFLLDTQTSRLDNLSEAGMQLADDAQSYTPHRALSFGPLGHRLAYLRGDEKDPTLVLRDLETGGEEYYQLDVGLVGRMQFEPDGEFIHLAVVTKDSNGNGRLQWPFPRATQKRGPCPGPIPHYSVWQWPGDDADTYLFSLRTTRARPVPGYVMTVGGAIVERRDNGELWLSMANGEQRRVSSEKCAGRVLHADPEHEAVYFGCGGAWGARRKVYARLSDRRVGLDFDLAGYEVDNRWPGRPEWVPLYPKNDTVLVTVADGHVHPLATETRVLATHHLTALAEHSGRIEFVYVDPTQVPDPKIVVEDTRQRRPRLSSLLQERQYVALDDKLFDLGKRQFAGHFAGRPLALSIDGYGLLPARNGDAQELAVGPLRWAQAKP